MFEIVEVNSKKELREFINFPYKLYKGNQYWIPPFRKDELKQLSPGENPSFEYNDHCFWIARENGRTVGRIGALINYPYNEKTGEKLGRFTRVEFIDDEKVSSALFDVAQNWAREKGMKKMHGPLGFNNLDNQGLLIEGFDQMPSIASVYHLPYYRQHVERLGYDKENDWIEFRLTLGREAVSKAIRGAALIKKRYGFKVRSFSSSAEMREYAHAVFGMMNQAFSELPYTTPFSDKMIDYVTDKYFKVLNPEFVKVILKDNEVVASIIGVPSLSEALIKARGRLLPFGLFYIMKAMKTPQVVDLYLTGVSPEYQKSGAAVVLFAELQEVMLAKGIDQMETTGIFEQNQNVISNWKNYPHIQHKRRRCFVKKL